MSLWGLGVAVRGPAQLRVASPEGTKSIVFNFERFRTMKVIWNTLAFAGLGIVAAAALAQPPEGPPPGRGPRGDGPGGGPGGPPIVRALDTDKDGELSADEIAKAADSLKSLDKNGDGKLTEDELRPPRPERGPGGPGPDERRGPGDFGPPRGEGPGPRERRRFSQDGPGPRGRRGPGGDFGPPPGPGGPPPMMPPHLREELGLSDEQVKQLDELHKEAREKFEKILTAEQLEKLKKHHPPGPPPRDRDE